MTSHGSLRAGDETRPADPKVGVQGERGSGQRGPPAPVVCATQLGAVPVLAGEDRGHVLDGDPVEAQVHLRRAADA
jgi:hypothetical protein